MNADDNTFFCEFDNINNTVAIINNEQLKVLYDILLSVF